MKHNILFICGSLNQTTMMHQISQHLSGHDCFFTPYYATGILGLLSRWGWLDFTILGGRHRRDTEAYLAKHELPVDFGGRSREYALVVTCTDVLVQSNLSGKRVVLVQEGITIPEGMLYYLVRYLRLPRFLANTAATGLSDAYDLFCVASPGYRDLFIRKGVKPEKIGVTGIPNFDHAAAYQQNDFPHRGFVLATTTSLREAFIPTDRIGFIRQVKRIAAGRQVIFKLHPNERSHQARREIQAILPEALVLTEGNVHHMIAQCDLLVTEYSSVVYTALALGKSIYANFDLELVRPLMPVQNGGTSARQIASACERLLEQPIPHLLPARGWLDRLFKPTVHPLRNLKQRSPMG